MSYAEWWWSQTASGPDPDAGDPIGQSLRFKGGGGVKLQRSSFPAVSTNDATINFWWKHAFNNNTGTGFLAITQPGVDIRFYGGGTMSDGRTYASGTPWRDPSAWYNFHLVYSYDTHRYKVYSNGVEIWDIAAFWTKTQGFMGGGAFTIGELDASNYKAPMYLASYHVVDGQALDPTTFGRYNANGVWVPVDPKKDGDTAWYGANGFHLTFADPADIGRDQSGNGNDFTATGFETTDQTSPLYDIMQDSPTNNFATFNAVVPDSGSNLTDANLVATNNRHNLNSTPSTISIEPNTGKYYWEITHTVASGNNAYGMSWAPPTDYGVGWYWSPKLNELYSASLTGRHPNYVSPAPASGVGVVQGFAYDSDTGNCWVRNDAGWYNSGDPDAGTNPFVAPADTRADLRLFPVKFGSTAGTTAEAFNFGQQPFKYDVPEGFEPLSTFYMPTDELPDEITGTFTGNSNADGPFVYTGCIPARIQYGTIDVKYQDRLGQTNVDFLSNGFKVRSTTSNSGTVNYTVTTTHDGGEYDGNKVPFNLPAPAVSN